ncbi:ATPase [Citreicella sp. C3M06]|uniref:ATPase n=1 Tax=Citreicella sp. C3M06 TaxID=2841564 RepID=UPI001C09E1C5|nr:ATPase [Citreicella sp. C3M06]MBU2963211.1 ATPase [Citreicella sp. C3M06]
MSFDWVTFGLQLFNVLVLLAILQHFLFRPVADIIARRQAEIVAAKDAADTAQARAAAAEAMAQDEAGKTAIARNDVLAAAQLEAEQLRATLVATAHSEASKIVDDARSKAARIAADGQTDTLRRARDLAETIAEKALSDLPDPPTAAGFAKRLAAELAAMPEGKRKALLSGANLTLIAAHPPGEQDLASARAVLAPLGLHDAAIEVDPALISGLELRSATGAVFNSIAHNLRRISEALDDDNGSRT